MFSQSAQDRVFYVAMHHLARDEELYLGLVSQTGLFSLLEPAASNSITSWKELDAFYPFEQMHRSVEPCFSLSFQSMTVISSGDSSVEVDHDGIMFAVSHTNAIKLYRYSIESEERRSLQEVSSFQVENDIVRSVAWAPANPTLDNLIAVLLDSGVIKLVEMVHKKRVRVPMDHSDARKTSVDATQRTRQSGIIPTLAGTGRVNGNECSDAQQHESLISFHELAQLETENRVRMSNIVWATGGRNPLLIDLGLPLTMK